ncbi:unnamed protein product [Closterium sp. Naga37s-1]|nr:unnamed protein product [Closterium sp. Naga37s-1]
MVIAGPTDYSPMRAGVVSVAYGMPPPASGTGTMATGPPTLPAPKPVTEDVGNLPRPAPSFPEAPASQPGDGGRQAPVLSAPLPVAPPVPLAAPTAASAPLGALQAADPAAPSAAAERAIVDGGVPAQSVGSATTDVLGQPALPAAPAQPFAPSPALVSPLPVLAGSAPAPPVAAPPAPPVAAPLAPPVAAPLAPPEAAPLAPPVAAPPAAGLSAPPVAVPIAPPVANPPVLSAQRPPSPGRRQQLPQSPARQDERETSRRRHNSPRRRGSQTNWAAQRGGRGGWWGPRQRGGGWGYDQPVTMADLQRVVSAAVREERNGQASQSNSPRVAQTPVAPPPTAPSAQAAPRPPPIVPPPPVPAASTPVPGNPRQLPWVPPIAGVEFLTTAGGPVIVQYPSLLPVDPPPPSVGAAHPFQALLGPQRTVPVPEVTLGQIWRLSEALRVVHLVQVYGHAALSQGDSLVGGPRGDCLAAADRLAELLAPVLAAPARGGLAGVGPLGSAVRGLRRLLHAGTESEAIAAGTMLVRELHRTMISRAVSSSLACRSRISAPPTPAPPLL